MRVSPRERGDLLDPDFPDAVAALLSDAHLGAESLMLEVTETSISDEFERAKHAVDRFRDLGARVSIDDFGAGFTSLAYLTDLPVAEMKLDRRFITPLANGTTSKNADLVRATIELGHALRLDVVAEGVENDLRWICCASSRLTHSIPPPPTSTSDTQR